jgi:transposase
MEGVPMKASLWAEIHRLHEIEQWSIREIARRLHCGRDTVNKALALQEPPQSSRAPRGTILDSYKTQIDGLIKKYPKLSAVRVLEEIRKKGYAGEITLVRRYLREIRPARGRVYQEVEYAPGEAIQVDWGSCGTITIGQTVRRVSVFVAVLCFSRLIYIQFTLSQTKAHFYRSLVNAFLSFGGVTTRLIIDNLKVAVAEGSGRDAIFHAEFREFCGYHRITPIACEKEDPESKGVVEGGVRYIKHNALQGRDEELTTFEDYHKLGLYWTANIANVRKHETTKERPIDRFEKERDKLEPLPKVPFDTDEIVTTIVTPHARVRFDSNRYSVPPQFARRPVIMRVDDKWLRVVHRGEEIARHARCWEKRQLLVQAEHRKAALAMRKRSTARQIAAQFDELGPDARAFRKGLLEAPVKSIVHLRRILELVRLYGKTEVLGALCLAVQYQTFDSAYVRNLIDQERRRRELPSPLPLSPQRKELIEDIHLDEPDPGEYDDLLP